MVLLCMQDAWYPWRTLPFSLLPSILLEQMCPWGSYSLASTFGVAGCYDSSWLRKADKDCSVMITSSNQDSLQDYITNFVTHNFLQHVINCKSWVTSICLVPFSFALKKIMPFPRTKTFSLYDNFQAIINLDLETKIEGRQGMLQGYCT